MTWQRFVIRVVAYATCLVAVLGLVTTAIVWQRLNQAELALRTQVREIGDTVDQIGASLMAVSQSAGSAAVTLEDAQGSLQTGASATSGAADALNQLAQALAFLGVGNAFGQQASELAALAGELSQTGAALDRNADDLRRIGQEVGQSAGDMSRVASQLDQIAGDATRPGSLSQLFDAIRLIVGGGMVLLLLVLFGIGASLFLLTTERGPAPVAPADSDIDSRQTNEPPRA